MTYDGIYGMVYMKFNNKNFFSIALLFPTFRLLTLVIWSTMQDRYHGLCENECLVSRVLSSAD